MERRYTYTTVRILLRTVVECGRKDEQTNQIRLCKTMVPIMSRTTTLKTWSITTLPDVEITRYIWEKINMKTRT